MGETGKRKTKGETGEMLMRDRVGEQRGAAANMGCLDAGFEGHIFENKES